RAVEPGFGCTSTSCGSGRAEERSLGSSRNCTFQETVDPPVLLTVNAAVVAAGSRLTTGGLTKSVCATVIDTGTTLLPPFESIRTPAVCVLPTGSEDTSACSFTLVMPACTRPLVMSASSQGTSFAIQGESLLTRVTSVSVQSRG